MKKIKVKAEKKRLNLLVIILGIIILATILFSIKPLTEKEKVTGEVVSEEERVIGYKKYQRLNTYDLDSIHNVYDNLIYPNKTQYKIYNTSLINSLSKFKYKTQETDEIFDKSNWNNFKLKYGNEWKIKFNKLTKIPTQISGYKIEAKEIARSLDIEDIARNFMLKNKKLLKIEIKDLKKLKKHSDIPVYPEKQTSGISHITYKQEYKNISVFKSFVKLTTNNNKIVKFKANYYPDIDISTIPILTEEQAGNIAKQAFEILRDKDIQEISLAIYPIETENNIDYRLAYKILLPLIKEPLSQYIVFVDANTGQIIDYYDTIIYAPPLRSPTPALHVSGRVTGIIYPEHTEQLPVEVPFKNNKIIINGIEVITNENGEYIVTSPLVGSISIDSYLEGPYVKVYNEDQDESHHRAILLYEQTHDWDWKDYDSSDRQEESNVFYHVNVVHDFFTKGDPFNIESLNFQMPATVEIRDNYCNAFYTFDKTINFGNSDKCGNLALISDVIYHEYTHGAVEHVYPPMILLYVEFGMAMHEGFADYFANTINNNSCLGEGFRGMDCLRNSKNTKRYPDDFVEESHTDSLIFSGSIWDLREVIGKSLVDNLTIMTMKLHPLSFSEFLDDMLIVDDNNEDLSDGTPHINEICYAFYDNHGILSGYCAGHTEIPIAIITSPKENEVIYETFSVYGTAYPSKYSSLVEYKIEISSDGISWEELISSNKEVVDNILLDLNTLLYLDGIYYLRLIVRDSDGKSANYTNKIEIDNNEITYPGVKEKYWIGFFWFLNTLYENCDEYLNNIYMKDTQTEIRGRVNSLKVESFYFEYANENEPDKWYSEGIEIVNSGEVLATWNISNLKDGNYILKLIETSIYGETSDIDKVKLTISKNIKSKCLNQHLGYFLMMTGLNIEDIDKKYIGKELALSVGGDINGKIEVLHYDLTPAFGWPQNATEQLVFSYPSIGDIDNDNNFEIITNFIGLSATDYYSKIYNFNYTGGHIENWPIEMYKELMIQSILEDINNDGFLDIIVITTNGTRFTLYLFNISSDYLEGWPLIFEYPADTPLFQPGMAVGDVDNDGKKEIAVCMHDKLYLLENNGTLAKNWPINLYTFDSDWYKDEGACTDKLIIADVDDKPGLEIIVSLNNYTGISWGYISQVHVYDKDGKLLEGWPKFINRPINSMSVGEIDKFNQGLEIIGVSTWINKTIVYVWDYKGNGAGSGNWPVDICNLGNVEAHPFTTAYPLIADIDEDNESEILVGCLLYGNTVYALNKDGSVSNLTKFVAFGDTLGPISTPILTDIDNDGDFDLVLVSKNNIVYIWDLKTKYDDVKLEWPMFQHDPQHTGRYTKPCEDSDFGKNYQVKGKVELRTGETYEDSCAGSFYLREYYCDGNQKKITSMVCQEMGREYICKDGACVSSIPPTPTPIEV